jgi:putative transposase
VVPKSRNCARRTVTIEQTEGAKFWLRVMNELKNRGVQDVLIAIVDGLRGFPEAINAVFPQTQIQTCIVHLIRNSLDYVGWKDRKAVAKAMKDIYRAIDAEAAAVALDGFEDGPWGRKFPAITAAWRRQWTQVIPFFAFPSEVRRMIYTTNQIEALNSKIRRSVRARGHFPSDDSATKLIWLQLREVTKDWKMPAREWHSARSQLSLLFGDRFNTAI